MGQQQLLLIVLGVIIVGIAVLLGINLFRTNAVNAKRDNLISDCIHLASEAQGYYMRPASFGGGGRAFTGWRMNPSLNRTANGRYMADVYQDSVVITGIGNEVVTGTDSVQVKVSVYPQSYLTKIIR